MAALKKLVLASTLLIAAYWLYTPIPDGYSLTSTASLQLILAGLKVAIAISNEAARFGIGIYATNFRAITDNAMAMMSKPDPDIKEVDYDFDGVPVRVYEPISRNAAAPQPGIIYYHGGGWMYGNIDSYGDVVREISKQTNMVVVSVEYRLAPEHIFPAAVDDCVKATKFFMENAKKFNVDPKRIAVSGDSAGGNLAAAVTLKFRDNALRPPIKLQVLIYPVLQGVDNLLPSMVRNKDGPLLTSFAVAYAKQIYMEGKVDKAKLMLVNGHISPKVKAKGLPFIDYSKLPKKYLTDYPKPDVKSGNATLWNEVKDRLMNRYFSPLLADRLNDLPQAFVYTAEYDPLRDEGFLYVSRLKEAGVKVFHLHSDIGFHGIISLCKYLNEAAEALKEIAKYISDNI